MSVEHPIKKTHHRTTHGHSVGFTKGLKPTPEYQAWAGMRRRCHDKGSSAFFRYGAKGIVVCDRWRYSFENFLADMGPIPGKGYTVDRFPNKTGNYEPGNCRWATWSQQQRNRTNNRMITFQGKTLCAAEWAEATGIPSDRIRYRLDISGWSIEAALTIPHVKRR